MQLQIISSTPYNPGTAVVRQEVRILDPIELNPFKIEFFSEKGLTKEEMIFSLTGFDDGNDINQLFGCDYMTSLCSKDNTDSIVNELISQFDDPDYTSPEIIRITIPVGEKELYIITATDEDCCGMDDYLTTFENVNVFGANGMDDVSLLDITMYNPDDFEEDEELEDHLDWVMGYRAECSFTSELDDFARQYASIFDMEPIADAL